MLGDHLDVREQKMFGGLTFMVAGHMCCGVVGDTLMLRLDEELANEALKKPHVRPMDFTGRPMKNVVYIDPPGRDTNQSRRGDLSETLCNWCGLIAVG